MSQIMRWECRLPGDSDGRVWPMVCVDEQTEAEYQLYGDLPECKTYIFHDGSAEGRAQAEAIARGLEKDGEAVRHLGRRGIVAIYNYCPWHRIYEVRGHLSAAEGRS
jgi:hypothetical protein